MLKAVVPEGVFASVTHVHSIDDPKLQALLDLHGPSTTYRQFAFATSRHLAQELMDSMGHKRSIVRIGSHGAPVWPNELCGSFSYKEKWCAVAIAERFRLQLHWDRPRAIRRHASESVG